MPTWTELVSQEFSGVDLGDERLEKRCLQLAAKLSAQPNKSVPQACGTWSDTKAAYRFFSNDRVTREKLLEPHIGQTIRRSNERTAIIAIQDTTYFTMGHQATVGLGSIGGFDEVQGFVAHSALAVCGDNGEVLGLMHQEVWARGERKPKNEKTVQRRRRPRESERWTRGIEQVCQLGIAAKVLHVFDREGDIYEALELLDRTRQGFVIRASSNRRLSNGQEYLFDKIRATGELGRIEIEVPAKKKQPGRKAALTVRAATLRIRPPLEFHGKGREIEVGIIQLCETRPPIGEEALEWLLLTSEAHATVEDCAKVARHYSKRWKIEEFHMGLKTGCAVEERQLQTRDRLEAFLGLANVIAVLLLRLRDATRNDQSPLATHLLSPIQTKLLAARYPKIGDNPSSREALRTIAQLGGFLARKGDGEPGWRTIWRGMQSLLLMEYGYITAATEKCG